MPTIKEVIKEITNPLRRNDLEERRRKLGLSRVALGRILDVDPATVFRHERGPLVALWHYAMRGIEAEAACKEAKQVIRMHKANLKGKHIFPDAFEARGESYVAEKMRAAYREEARKGSAPRQPGKKPGKPQSMGQSEATKRTADKYIADPVREK
jgi:DNA-binding XRE family transcriptional regulator